jgi:hypothetical protein
MELGFDLFVRESKSVTLTAARRSFLKGPKENTGNGRNQCGSVTEPLLRDVKMVSLGVNHMFYLNFLSQHTKQTISIIQG